MKIFDNVTSIVRDDMKKTIKQNSKVSIAAACFSMYAYSELKKQLESIEYLKAFNEVNVAAPEDEEALPFDVGCKMPF